MGPMTPNRLCVAVVVALSALGLSSLRAQDDVAAMQAKVEGAQAGGSDAAATEQAILTGRGVAGVALILSGLAGAIGRVVAVGHAVGVGVARDRAIAARPRAQVGRAGGAARVARA